MDLQRLFLFLIFSFSLVLVWDGWQRHQHPENYIQQKSNSAGIGQGESSQSKDTQKGEPLITNIGKQAKKTEPGKTIYVSTNLLDAEINSVGGDITYLALKKHPDAQDKSKPLVLFNKSVGSHSYVAQSGLLGPGLPTHNSDFEIEKDRYQAVGNQSVKVLLHSAEKSDLKVTKSLVFNPNNYQINIGYELENTGNSPIPMSSYYQLVRDSQPPEGSSKLLPTFTGVAVYTSEDKFKKVNFSDIESGTTDYTKESENGWIGVLQHYFVSAWIPKAGEKREYFTRKLEGDLYAAGVIIPDVVILPGEKKEINSVLYAGPAQTRLDKIAEGLGLTVDYGWLTIIATPLFWLMTQLNDWTNNWGVAIIILTFLIKLLFFPLSAASYRSMAKMRLVAPKLEKIKQQYGDDREQLNRAMMDLYRTEKINPLGGCLPVLIQIPVFIALYWSILSSVEMRFAPFYGWITDLSAADPYYVLPVVMGLSMVVQMRLNPAPPDPIQAKVMQIMPIAFSIIFFFFPAGLVLYSIVNNLLSIAQQWYITRVAEAEKSGAPAKR